jgi:hypothetical protein
MDWAAIFIRLAIFQIDWFETDGTQNFFRHMTHRWDGSV